MLSIKVVFFASFKELLGCSSIEVTLEQGATVGDLCGVLSQRCEGDEASSLNRSWEAIFSEPSKRVKVACNQHMVDFTTELNSNDEVAFFPPVTGG